MYDDDAPEWMDETGFGVIGRFTLNDGEQLTAEIVGFKEETNELVVQLISAGASFENVEQPSRAIEVGFVRTFTPEPRSSHAWPHSDLCRNRSFSASRFALMSTLFLSATLGSIGIFIALRETGTYWLQEASAISYSLAVIWLSFAAHKKAPSYMFTCPAVAPQIPKLLWRHLGFLLGLFLLESAALAARPNLSPWWFQKDRKGGTPFEAVLVVLCIGLGMVQIQTNRSLLKRAHAEFIG
jgi:hypothetical protein